MFHSILLCGPILMPLSLAKRLNADHASLCDAMQWMPSMVSQQTVCIGFTTKVPVIAIEPFPHRTVNVVCLRKVNFWDCITASTRGSVVKSLNGNAHNSAAFHTNLFYARWNRIKVRRLPATQTSNRCCCPSIFIYNSTDKLWCQTNESNVQQIKQKINTIPFLFHSIRSSFTSSGRSANIGMTKKEKRNWCTWNDLMRWSLGYRERWIIYIRFD